MLTRWNDLGWGRWGRLGLDDLEGALAGLDTLRRDMDRWFTDYDRQFGEPDQRRAVAARWPRMTLSDTGSALTLRAELPGFKDEDISVTVHDTTLSISGERKVEVPEGYDVHRRERGELKFSRSATLPTKVDAEKAQASLKQGVLELTLPKAPEAQPKQIAVKGG
jgi:HSP20 family protein